MNSIPYARMDASGTSVQSVAAWLRYCDLLDVVRNLPPDTEFSILLDFLVEYAGAYEMADQRAMELCVEQAVISRAAHWGAVKAIKDRISELYRKARESG